MKVLGPLLFNLFRRLSLLAALMIAVLWVRSYAAYDQIRIEEAAQRDFVLTSGGGMVHLRRVSVCYRCGIVAIGGSYQPAFTERLRRMAFHGVRSTRRGKLPWWLLVPKDFRFSVPYCVLLVPCIPGLLALLPAWRRRRRVRQGLCGICGYDLRATPQRCPECGTMVDCRAAASSRARGTIATASLG